MPNFLGSTFLHWSIFGFKEKKRKLPFKNLIPVPNFDIMGKNMYSAYTYNLKTSKFFSDGPKENFLVYTHWLGTT